MSLHDEKVELLRKSELFSNLREYELDIIAKYSEFIRVKKGQMIFHQGARPKSMYIIQQGRVGIISFDDNDVTIAIKTAGDSFGELDLLGMSQRNDSAMVEEESMLLRFPAFGANIESIFKEKPYFSSFILRKILGALAVKVWNIQKSFIEKARWVHELRKQILYDKMSGLYNRNFFEEDFIKILSESSKSIALVMIKPDNFKKINDTYGHKVGDQVLKLLAIFLVSELDEKDIGVRYGGDEFAAIIFDVDMHAAIARAKEIKRTLESLELSPMLRENPKIKVSMGIALYPEHAKEGMLLVEEAYRKLYKARSFGSCIVI